MKQYATIYIPVVAAIGVGILATQGWLDREYVTTVFGMLGIGAAPAAYQLGKSAGAKPPEDVVD